MGFTEWINENSGLITVITMVALVIITAVYVFLTYRISKTSSQNLTASIMPIVIINLEKSSRFNIKKWVIENVGNGPALKVVAEGIQESADAHNEEPLVNTGHFDIITKYFDGGKAVISNRLGTRIRVFPGSTETDNIYFKAEWWNILFTYEDIYGNVYRTVHKDGVMAFSKI